MSISDTHKHIHGYTFPHAHQYAYPPPLTLSHTQMVILTGDGNDGGSDDDRMYDDSGGGEAADAEVGSHDHNDDAMVPPFNKTTV